MALDHILKAAPFTWGAGSVGSTGLGIGGGYLHEEVSNVAWDHQLGKEGYSLNIPLASSWGPNVTNDDTFGKAKTLQSGPCFENFFPGVGKIENVLEEEAKEDKNFEKKKQSSDPAIGCAIQKISYEEKLTEIKNGGKTEWRVLPKNMVYKSEITLKKGDLGLAVWTLGTGKLKQESNGEFKEGESQQQYKFFLLAKEDNKGVAKGKYNAYTTKEFTITRDNLVFRKISMKAKGKQEAWFDATVTYTEKNKSEYEESGWKNLQSVSFGEEGGTEGFSSVLIMGSGVLSPFTGDPKDPNEKQKIKNMFKDENLLSAGHSHFNGTKGEWKELTEFCEYMKKTKGKNVSQKDAYIAKNLCYKK